MLYRRNCNTLLSSSLQRCYINGVCFAFQLAALWKRCSVICPWEHQLTSKCFKKRKKGGGTRTCRADLDTWVTLYPTQTYTVYDLGQWEREAHAPGVVDMFCSCSMSNNRAAPPPSPSQEANQLSSINQTQSIDSYLVKRSTNELGFDRYGVLKNQ